MVGPAYKWRATLALENVFLSYLWYYLPPLGSDPKRTRLIWCMCQLVGKACSSFCMIWIHSYHYVCVYFTSPCWVACHWLGSMLCVVLWWLINTYAVQRATMGESTYNVFVSVNPADNARNVLVSPSVKYLRSTYNTFIIWSLAIATRTLVYSLPSSNHYS